MVNTLFAVLLGAIAVYALIVAFRATPRARTGWLIVAVAAVAQAWNLLSGYSVWIAVLATAALVAGYLMARTPAHAPPP